MFVDPVCFNQSHGLGLFEQHTTHAVASGVPTVGRSRSGECAGRQLRDTLNGAWPGHMRCAHGFVDAQADDAVVTSLAHRDGCSKKLAAMHLARASPHSASRACRFGRLANSWLDPMPVTHGPGTRVGAGFPKACQLRAHHYIVGGCRNLRSEDGGPASNVRVARICMWRGCGINGAAATQRAAARHPSRMRRPP